MRVFLRWDRIEQTDGAPDWQCRYLTTSEVGGDGDDDGTPDPLPGIPCDGTPCGCGYSADERIAAAAAGDGTRPMAVLVTLLGTPRWARGARAPQCPALVPGRALPLRADKAGAFIRFAEAAARRYGDVAYGFELWNEPDLAGCQSWAGTRGQYREQILAAARAVKTTGVQPGLVVAPTLEHATPAAMDDWMDWSAPVDVLSFNIYTVELGEALGRLEQMHAWCRSARRCPGFYVTEFGAQARGPRWCPGPFTATPGLANVTLMKRCRKRSSCRGVFIYTLSEQNPRPDCDRGLIDRRGCHKRRFCTMARRFFGRTVLPFSCRGCGP